MPTKKTDPIPSPVPKQVICSVCDQDWDLHPENPTLLDCVQILKRRIPYNWNYRQSGAGYVLATPFTQTIRSTTTSTPSTAVSPEPVQV